MCEWYYCTKTCCDELISDKLKPITDMTESDIDLLADSWRHAAFKIRGVWSISTSEHIIHRHPNHWQLLILQSGSATDTSATAQHDIQAGEIALFRPWDITSGDIHGHLKAMVILFSQFTADNQVGPLDRISVPFIMPSALPHKLEEALTAYQNKGWSLMRHAVEARLAFDQFLWSSISQALDDGRTSITQREPRWLIDLKASIREELANPTFGVAALAGLAGWSERHMAREIKRYTGKRPTEIVRELRVERLLHMVQSDPDTDIHLLVDRCGFGTPRRLHAHVQATLGQTLGQIRAR